MKVLRLKVTDTYKNKVVSGEDLDKLNERMSVDSKILKSLDAFSNIEVASLAADNHTYQDDMMKLHKESNKRDNKLYEDLEIQAKYIVTML